MNTRYRVFGFSEPVFLPNLLSLVPPLSLPLSRSPLSLLCLPVCLSALLHPGQSHELYELVSLSISIFWLIASSFVSCNYLSAWFCQPFFKPVLMICFLMVCVWTAYFWCHELSACFYWPVFVEPCFWFALTANSWVHLLAVSSATRSDLIGQ